MRIATVETAEIQTDVVLALYEGLIAKLGETPDYLMIACYVIIHMVRLSTA